MPMFGTTAEENDQSAVIMPMGNVREIVRFFAWITGSGGAKARSGSGNDSVIGK